MKIKYKALLFGGIAAISLVGCTDRQSSDAGTSAANSNVGAPSPAAMDADSQHSALLTAAEPFEALTEQAATASPVVLDKLVADARSAADAISGSLDQAQRARLDSQLADIATGRKSDDRTRIALAAVEGYRTLVENSADSEVTPQAVSLLDYAGFRYQANLAAQPARWADAAATVDFADSQWTVLGPQIAEAPLRDEMSRSLANMRKAVLGKDESLARSASTTELDLVDKLEVYFASKG